jgi:hypothetical protein
LRRGILHCHPIGFELKGRIASYLAIAGRQTLLGIVEMREEDFLGQCQRSIGAEDSSNFGEPLQELRIGRSSRGEDVGR